MKNRNILILALCFFACTKAQSQIEYDNSGNMYIRTNPRLFRGIVGYSNTGMSLDSLPVRNAKFLYLRIEARVISGFMSKKNKFAIRDAFWLDMGMGWLSSDQLSYGGYLERKFSVHTSFGYECLAGYRNHNFGAFGGLKFAWVATIVGSSYMPGKTLYAGYTPLFVRGEYRIGKGVEQRIAVMAWNNFKSDKKYAGASIDFPLSSKWRYYLTAEYRYFTGNAAPASYDNGKFANGKCSQILLGFKFGAIY